MNDDSWNHDNFCVLFALEEGQCVCAARVSKMNKAPDAPTSEASVSQPPAKETERDQ